MCPALNTGLSFCMAVNLATSHSKIYDTLARLLRMFSNSLVWRRRISQSTARQRHSMLVVVICDLPTLASSSFHARGQVTATVVLPFMVPSCGILCHTTCGQLTSLWPLSEIDWKHSCLTLTRSSAFAALANLGYISDIIIIIIIKVWPVEFLVLQFV